jgi:hypothetical protein
LEKRHRQVQVLVGILRNGGNEWVYNFKNELENMRPFDGEASRGFKTGCDAILKTAQEAESVALNKRKNNSAKEVFVPDESLCIVCIDDFKTMVAVPCGHHLYCKSCYMSKSRKSYCAICRESVFGYLQVDHTSIQSLCLVCEKNPPDMFSVNCSHVSLCQTCCENGSPKVCLVCDFPSQRYQKLYR